MIAQNLNCNRIRIYSHQQTNKQIPRIVQTTFCSLFGLRNLTCENIFDIAIYGSLYIFDSHCSYIEEKKKNQFSNAQKTFNFNSAHTRTVEWMNAAALMIVIMRSNELPSSQSVSDQFNWFVVVFVLLCVSDTLN